MEKIELKQTLPRVFAQRTDIVSEVWKCDVEFRKGGLYLIEAASGTGKSSLCSFVIGYRHDFQGQILFDGQDVSQLGVDAWIRLRQRHLSLLFQELRLFPELTAMENVLIKNKLTGFKSEKDIRSWFERLGIADKMNARVAHMSFGQQQRVAMIRALVQPFDFILVDEPISHLDEQNSQVMADVMMEEARRQGAGVIVTSIGKHMKLNYETIFHL